MSKLAAIEARATQYPASANDVVWLTHIVRAFRKATEELLLTTIADEHSSSRQWCDACEAISHLRAALALLDEPNLP